MVCPLAGYSGSVTLPRARGCPPRVGPRSFVQADSAIVDGHDRNSCKAEAERRPIPPVLPGKSPKALDLLLLHRKSYIKTTLWGTDCSLPVERFRSSLCRVRPTRGNPRKGSLHWDNPQYRCAGECFENTAFYVPESLLLSGLAGISRPITSLDRCRMTSLGVTSNADVIDLL